MASRRTLRCRPNLVLAGVPPLALAALIAWQYATETDHTRQRLDRLAELTPSLLFMAAFLVATACVMRSRVELSPGHVELISLGRKRLAWSAIEDVALRRDQYYWQVEVRVGATRHSVHALTCLWYPRSYREAVNRIGLREWFRSDPPPQAPAAVRRPYQTLREEWLRRR